MNADLIAKIQKLRALAQSANVNEAANAAAAAERLIAEHQLSEVDLTTPATPVETIDEDREPIMVNGSERRCNWKESLTSRLASLYGVALHCKWVTVEEKIDVWPYEKRSPRVGFTAIGRKSDVEILRYQNAYLSLEIERLAQKFLDSNRFARGEAKTAANNFRFGAVEGVLDAMADARASQVAQHSHDTGNTNAAMVLVSRREEATAKFRALYPHLFGPDGERKGKGHTYRYRGNEAAREAGRRAGSSLHQRGALGNGAKGMLGGKS